MKPVRDPDLSRVPPQAPELEQAILGACIYQGDAFSQLNGILEGEHFYVDAHKMIWWAIEALARRGDPVDLLTVVDQLKKRAELDIAGGAFYLSQLTGKVSSTANIEAHARIVQQKFMLRKMIDLSYRLRDIDETDDVFDIMDRVNEDVGKLNAMSATKDPVSAAEIISGIIDNRKQPLYLHFGMGDLDQHVAIGPKDVVVIGARPSVGKTTFALNACMNIARDGHKVLFVSLEMTDQKLGAKVISALTGIDSERITKGEMNEEERGRMALANSENGMWIPRILVEDLSTMKDSQIFGILERAVKRHKCELAVVDYLQLVTANEDSRYEKMTAISIAFKQAAKASGIRLVELSQLKRRDGADVDPVMSDLRESGQLEADGDIIILLGREKGSQRLLAKVVKNKTGPIGDVELPFDLLSQRIGAPYYDPNKFIEPRNEDQPF